MSFLHREPTDEQRRSGADLADDLEPTAVSAHDVPLTRAGAAWVSVSAAALVAILLIIFLAQNTHRVHVSFLWMSTSTSLALMLLIAAVGGIFMTVILGTARIVQLRRMIRGRVVR